MPCSTPWKKGFFQGENARVKRIGGSCCPKVSLGFGFVLDGKEVPTGEQHESPEFGHVIRGFARPQLPEIQRGEKGGKCF
jgi:hypothetical protein